MKLTKFYVTMESDETCNLQVCRMDDIEMNEYKKTVTVKLNNVMEHVESLDGNWFLFNQLKVSK